MNYKRSNIVSCALSVLLFLAVFMVVPNVSLVGASSSVTIRADGSIDPPTAPISTLDNMTYAFTDNINDSIVVQRDNIVIDGKGHMVQGVGNGTGIDLSRTTNVTIMNIEITAFRLGIYGFRSSQVRINADRIWNSSTGVYFITSSAVDISGNNITNNKSYGVWFSSSSGNTILANNITENNAGIYLYYSPHNIISGNIITFNNKYGIYLQSSSDCTIFGNTIASNVDRGINLYSSSNTNISRNSVSKNGIGLYLELSSSNILSENNITANDGRGIYIYRSLTNNVFANNISANFDGVFLYYSSSNVISGNHITANNESGVYVYSASEHNIILGNNVTKNKSGVYLDSSSNNSISRNNITANSVTGVYLNYSSGNSIYSNNFVSNPIQVNTTGSANTWDAGYPTFGNYWSDYTGVDIYSGAYQNETESDGVGDTWYVIDNDNRDRYPLIHLWVTVSPVADFSYSPEYPLVGRNATFNALASYDPDAFVVSYRWDFGDSNVITVTTPIVEHIYMAVGTFPVNLTVANMYGLNSSVLKLVAVIVDVTPPTTVDDYDGLWHTSDFNINLAATDSIPGSRVAETYYKINNSPAQEVSTFGQPLITAESANNTLEYWSVDNAGNEELPHKIVTEIKLDKTNPIANAGADQTVYEDTQVTLNGSASTDENGIATYTWTFNDTTPRTLNAENPTHTFVTTGIYWVTLEVTDPAGNSATDSMTVTVRSAEVPPHPPTTEVGTGIPLGSLIGIAAIAVIAIAVIAIFVWKKEHKTEPPP